MYKRLIFLGVLALWATAGFVFSGSYIDRTITVLFGSTDTTGDTAMAISFRVNQALDSHQYIDTFVTGSAAADSTAVEWTSPVQTMILTFGVITATPTLVDTTAATGLGKVGCTAVFNTTTETGITYDMSDGADATLATAIDGFVAMWNAVGALADSIEAEDSVTYIKLVSQYSEHNLGARWSVQLASSAGAGATDSLDTASNVVPTIAIVCDSMNAAVNAAMSGVLTSVTDTTSLGVVDSFVVTSDDPGLPFTVYFGDSISAMTPGNEDTVHGQLNVTSYSGYTDTFDLVNLISADGNLYPSVVSIDLLASTKDTLAGFGDSDSGYVWLFTVFDEEYHVVAAETTTSLPCNLRAAWPGSVAYDSTFKSRLAIGWRVADTVSDTVMTGITYDIEATYILDTK